MDFGQPLFYPDACLNILLLLPFFTYPGKHSQAALQAVPFTRYFFLKKKSKANPEIAEVDFLLSTETQLHLVSDTGTHVHT